ADFVPFQGHDFSFRGMFGKHAAAISGFGHLASGLVGTDTIPAVLFAENITVRMSITSWWDVRWMPQNTP
ncbi:MAG: hypothetical protein R3227_13935, partial [Reinekea sp.]|nr:hypothetical protein [Reinekea sp.]